MPYIPHIPALCPPSACRPGEALHATLAAGIPATFLTAFLKTVYRVPAATAGLEQTPPLLIAAHQLETCRPACLQRKSLQAGIRPCTCFIDL